MTTIDDLDCPRCGRPLDTEYYGPCEACRTELRATFHAAPRAVEPTEYVPKTNVTPNAVALRDD